MHTLRKKGGCMSLEIVNEVPIRYLDVTPRKDNDENNNTFLRRGQPIHHEDANLYVKIYRSFDCCSRFSSPQTILRMSSSLIASIGRICYCNIHKGIEHHIYTYPECKVIGEMPPGEAIRVRKILREFRRCVANMCRMGKTSATTFDERIAYYVLVNIDGILKKLEHIGIIERVRHRFSITRCRWEIVGNPAPHTPEDVSNRIDPVALEE